MAAGVRQALQIRFAEKHRIFSCQAHTLPVHTSAAMNKAELIETIQAALGQDATKRAADEALEAVLSSIVKGVKKDKKVQIVGFGTFEVKERSKRIGRNPKTGEAMEIPASKSVGFKPATALKASL
jgi:DNA-binding protein HU-beta